MKIKTGDNQITKTKTRNYISLPKSLVERVQGLNLTKTYYSQAIKFIGILQRDSFREHGDLSSFTAKPNSFIIKTFGDRYIKWMNPLLESQIVLRSEYYSKEKHTCFSYGINPICYQGDVEVEVAYEDVVKQKISSRLLSQKFAEDFQKLSIDYDLLRKVVEDKVSSLNIDAFKTNSKIKEGVIRLQNSKGELFYIGVENALENALKQGKTLIQDKSKYIIENPDLFIERKKIAVRTSYLQSILEIEKGVHRANRNSTNNRLDTNLTNMCSALVKEICRQNNLAQIDLSNSQFTILSHILSTKLETTDFKRFKELSVSGELYTHVADLLDLEDSKAGKNAMFEIMFSSWKNNSKSKTILKRNFPTVIAWIDKFKRVNGYKEFAIMLQRFESDLFIDKLLSNLHRKGLLVFTKHDSVICGIQDVETVKVEIENLFASLEMKYQIKVELPKNECPEVLDKKKEKMKSKFETLITDKLLIADFRILMGKYVETILVKDRLEIIWGLGYGDFEIFWERLQDFKLRNCEAT